MEPQHEREAGGCAPSKRQIPAIAYVLLFIIASTGLLAACASAGTNFDERKLSQIKKGVTTEAELVQLFGQPVQRGMDSEGRVTLTWVYAESHVRGESFIPVANLFVDSYDTKHKSLAVTLTNGTVSSFNFSGGRGVESKFGTGNAPQSREQK